MAESAAQIQYRQEYISGFELSESLTRQTVTTEAIVKGQQAVFLVVDSGGAEAVTRGLNGLIPGRPDNNTQNTVTLTEWHDKPIKPGFNIFISQGDQRKAMNETSYKVMNHKIDSQIITELNTATQDTGGAQPGSLPMIQHALTILGNNEVPFDGNISALISPAFYSYMMQIKQFTNVDYVNNKPFSGMLTMFRWNNVNWIVHPNLPGKGTNAEKCFMYHKAAIGHAMDKGGITYTADYNKEQDYSWALATGYMGVKLLQSEGIVVMNHDGSAFALA